MADSPSAREQVREINESLTALHARQRELGEDIEAGRRADSERFEGFDAKLSEVQRKIDEGHERLMAAARDEFQRANGGDDDLDRYLIVGDDGKIRGLRMYESVQEFHDPHLGRGQDIAPGFLSDQPRTQLQREMQEAVGHLQLAKHCRASERTMMRHRGRVIRLLRSMPARIRAAFGQTVEGIGKRSMDPTMAFGAARGAQIRALGDTAGSGQEWILENTAPGIERPWVFEGAGMDFLQVRRVGADEKILKVDGYPEFFIGSAVGFDDPAELPTSNVTTSSETIDVGVLHGRIAMNSYWREDLAPGAYEEILRKIDQVSRWIVSMICLHGDAAATHQDAIEAWTLGGVRSTDLGGTNDPLRFFEGFRADAFDNSATTNQGSATSYVAALTATLALLGDAAAGEVTNIISPEYLISDVMVDPKVVTVDVFGEQATIKTDPRGLGRLFHVKLRVNKFLGPEFETTGLYTDGSGAKDTFVVVVDEMWELVIRREFTIELARRPETAHDHLVYSLRFELRKRESAATKAAACAINL